MFESQRHQLRARDEAERAAAKLAGPVRVQIVNRPAQGRGFGNRPGKLYTLWAWGVYADGGKLVGLLDFNRGGACRVREPEPTESWQPACSCCERGDEYNGYGSDGPRLFDCPKGCPCHD